MLIYILFIAFCLFAHLSKGDHNKANHRVLVLSSALLILIMGLRSSMVGNDTLRYCEDYLRYRTFSWEQIIKEENPGFRVFNKLVSYVFPDSYTPYLLIVALIIVTSLFIFLKNNSEDVLISQIMLLSLEFTYFFMTGIKQTLAIAFLLFAYGFLKRKKHSWFFAFLLLAISFHFTAIVFLLALPLYYLKIPKKAYLIIVPVLVVLSFVFQSNSFDFIKRMLDGKIYDAYGYSYKSSINLTGLFIQVAIFAVSYLLIWNNSDEKGENGIRHVLNFSAIGMVFQAMSPIMGEFFRISMYFSIFNILLLPKALATVSENTRKAFSVICFSAFVLYFVFFSGNNSNYVPYSFFWQ